MELENKGGVITSNEEEDDVHLPGFRFHPTDEELVGFYLRRKVEKRPISIKLIEQVDIYKYDPWDLPKSSINGGDKEWYFFCKRGRKYRNSIRPNRVTSSGFWKATGIDKPIYSSGHVCIGLKKSLVYYRGTAGKGTKTDWMMHEFRLPSTHAKRRTSKDMDAECFAQEAEVWTLCRILKRHISYRKGTPADWQVGAKRSIISPEIDTTSQISSDHENRIQKSNYISFSAPMNIRQKDEKPYSNYVESITQAPFPACSFLSHPICADVNELLRHADWEDLRSIVDHTAVAASINPFYF